MKNFTINLKEISIILFLLIVSSLNAQSQKQNIQLFAEIDATGSMLQFQWVTRAQDEIDLFQLNFTTELENGLIFENFDVYEEFNSRDLEREEIERNGQVESYIYSYTVPFEFDEGETVAFFISGQSDNDDFYSNPVVFGNQQTPREKIVFLTSPDEIGIIDEEFYYDADAILIKDSSDKDITYQLQTNLPNVNFNRNTGELRWTPKRAGIYNFSILAINKNQQQIRAYQHFSVLVKSCLEKTLISGTILDQDNEPIEEGIVQFFRSEENSNGGIHLDFYAEVEDGEFSVEVDEGTYYGVYQSYEYELIPQWYNGAYDYNEATEINIECGESQNIEWKIRTDVNYEDRYAIQFISQPERFASQEEEYTYESKAVYINDEDAELVYSLVEGPEGMEINEETGYLTWTPDAAGNYIVYIKAELAEDDFVIGEQRFMIQVLECSDPANISGNIFTENGESVGDGYVTLVRTFGDSLDLFEEAASGEVIDGKFSLDVDKGTYILYVYTEYMPTGLFWDGTPNYLNAKKIEVECGDEFTIDWEVEGVKRPQFVSVSGYCNYQDSSAAKAMVIFEGVNERNSGNNGHQNNTFQVKVMTNQNGYYEAEVLAGLEYIAYAFAENSNRPLFYNQTYDPERADRLMIDEDRTGINFSFTDIETDNGPMVRISGSVSTESGLKVSNVMIIGVTMNNRGSVRNENSAMGISDSEGNFEFAVSEGVYKFLAFPLDGNYMPGFYVADNITSMVWTEGTEVEILEDINNPINIDVILTEMESVPGIAGLIGQVVSSNDHSMAVQSANVYLTHNGKAVQFSTSSMNGEFQIPNVQAGEYTLVVDKPGFETFETDVTLSNEEALDLQIPLIPDGISSVEFGMDDEFSINPNPVNDQINLSISSDFNPNEISVYDINGNVLIKYNVRNNQTYNFDASLLNSGSYYLHVSNGTDIKVIPFVVVE